MSKITLILLISISFQYVLADSEMGETLYNYIKDFFAGMAEDEGKSQCVNIINAKKEDFIRYIEPLINAIDDTQKFFNIFIENILKLVTIHGFAKNCKILNVIIFYNKLTIKEQIKSLSESVINNAKNISAIFNKTVTEESIFKKIGKSAKIILDINVK